MASQEEWIRLAWDFGHLTARFLEEFADMCRGSENGEDARTLMRRLADLASQRAEGE